MAAELYLTAYQATSLQLYVLIYDAEKWPLSKNLVYHVYGLEFRSVKNSGPSSTPSLRTVFAGTVNSGNELMSTL